MAITIDPIRDRVEATAAVRAAEQVRQALTYIDLARQAVGLAAAGSDCFAPLAAELEDLLDAAVHDSSAVATVRAVEAAVDLYEDLASGPPELLRRALAEV